MGKVHVKRLKNEKAKTDVIKKNCTVSPVDMMPAQESDYTDIQFVSDLKKVSKQLDSMAAEALKEHAQGNTQEFPV